MVQHLRKEKKANFGENVKKVVSTGKEKSGIEAKSAKIDASSEVNFYELGKEENSTNKIIYNLDESFSKELECTVLLEMVNRETVESVGVIVMGLGFSDVIVRGVSTKKFLAFFRAEESLNEVDLDFLKTGFEN